MYQYYDVFILLLTKAQGSDYENAVDAVVDMTEQGFRISAEKAALKKGDKVVIIDDLIATGGTLEAAAKLVEQLGAEVVRIVCLIELTDLKGREKLKKYDVRSIVTYEGE